MRRVKWDFDTKSVTSCVGDTAQHRVQAEGAWAGSILINAFNPKEPCPVHQNSCRDLLDLPLNRVSRNVSQGEST